MERKRMAETDLTRSKILAPTSLIDDKIITAIDSHDKELRAINLKVRPTHREIATIYLAKAPVRRYTKIPNWVTLSTKLMPIL